MNREFNNEDFMHERGQINKPSLTAELREELLEALNAAMRSGRKAGWWDSNASTMDKIQAAIKKLEAIPTEEVK